MREDFANEYAKAMWSLFTATGNSVFYSVYSRAEENELILAPKLKYKSADIFKVVREEEQGLS